MRLIYVTQIFNNQLSVRSGTIDTVDSRLFWILRMKIVGDARYSTGMAASIVTVEMYSLLIVTKVYENILWLKKR